MGKIRKMAYKLSCVALLALRRAGLSKYRAETLNFINIFYK
jgi:hypothetical protein